MSETKFTPGPWNIHAEYRDEIRGAKDEMICAAYAIADAEANARLIAAAPELFEALNFYVAICGNTAAVIDRESAQQAYELAVKAMRKAVHP